MSETQATNSSVEPASRVLVVKNKMGIHARPAAMIVRIANRYAGDVWVVKDSEQVNGKSIMGLMMLAAGNGSRLQFIIEDPKGETFLDEIEALFERKFDEA